MDEQEVVEVSDDDDWEEDEEDQIMSDAKKKAKDNIKKPSSIKKEKVDKIDEGMKDEEKVNIEELPAQIYNDVTQPLLDDEELEYDNSAY